MTRGTMSKLEWSIIAAIAMLLVAVPVACNSLGDVVQKFEAEQTRKCVAGCDDIGAKAVPSLGSCRCVLKAERRTVVLWE